MWSTIGKALGKLAATIGTMVAVNVIVDRIDKKLDEKMNPKIAERKPEEILVRRPIQVVGDFVIIPDEDATVV